MEAKPFRVASTLPYVVVLASAASILLFARGWIRADMAAKIPWESAGATRLAALSAVYWLLFVGVVWVTRARLRALAVAALIATAAFAGVVSVLAVVLLVFAGTAIGGRVVGPMPRRILDSDAGQLAVSAAIGLALLAIALPIAGLLPVNNSVTYLAALALPVVLYGRSTLRSIASVLRRNLGSASVVDLALLGVLGNFVLVHVVAALLPETGYDALVLHLDVAARVRDFGRWHYDVGRNVFAVIPLGGDFLYAAAYMFGGEHGARLTNVATLVLALVIVYAAVRESGSRSVALIAALVAASSPLALLESVTLHIENPWTLFIVGAVVCVLRFTADSNPVSLRAGALLVAAAMATKTVTLALLPALLACVIGSNRPKNGGVPTRHVIAVLAMAAVLSLPPYLIALVKTGNPVFPFFNAVFKSPFFALVNFSNPRFPGELDPRSVYNFTFHSDAYLEGGPGSFGFGLILLLLPVGATAVLAGGRRERWLLAMIVTFFVIVVTGTAYLRYLYPVVFLFAILLGLALGQIQQGVARLALVTASAATVLLNVLFLPAAPGQFRDANLPAIANESARHDFVSTWAPGREIVGFLNAYARDTGPVALFARSTVAELRRRYYLDSWYMRDFHTAVESVKDLNQFSQLIHRLDLAFLLLDSSASPSIRDWTMAMAEPVYRVGDATLYRVDTRLRFPRELAKGARLEPGFSGWTRHGQVRFDTAVGAAVVSSSDLLYQVVPVEPRQHYRLAVEEKCAAKPAHYRLQVIWHSARGPIGSTVLVLPCTANWTESDEIVTPPGDAAFAVVYATGHEAEPVFVRSSSFAAR